MTPWTRPALRKLFQVHERIAQDNPAAAEQTIQKIYTAANLLERFPKLGRPSDLLAVREMVVAGTPYVLQYRIRGGKAQIVNLKYGRQSNYR